MPTTGEQLRQISKNLNWFYADAQTRAKLGLFDLNKDAERIFGKILSWVLGYELNDLNREKYNHPAVDFGNEKERVAVQITTTVSDRKIQHTLEMFLKYHLDTNYDHIIVMMIALDTAELAVPASPPHVTFTKEDIWSIPKLVSKIEALSDSKIDEISRYLDEQMGALQNMGIVQAKARLTLGLSALAPGEFLGREEELDAIEQRVRGHYSPIELYGFGGMGKTELAIEYGRRKMDSTAVFFARFSGTIRDTITGPIADAFSGYSKTTAQGIPKPEQMIYAEVMNLLGGLDNGAILIIDNVDGEGQDFSALCGPEYTALCGLRLNLIITTRFDRSENGGIEVGALKRKYLYEMILRILDKTTIVITKEKMDELIQTVDSHTLTVELCARTLKMSRPRMTPEALLEKLRAGDLGDSNFAKVASRKDRDQQKRRIEEHIRNLFRISDLPPAELSYMANATLICEEYGLPYDWFAEAQSEFDQDVMQHLLDRGWIQLDQKTDMLSIHPLIRQVARGVIEPSVEVSGSFLNGLRAIFERNYQNGIDNDAIVYLITGLPKLLQDWIPISWCYILRDWCLHKLDEMDVKIDWMVKSIAGMRRELDGIKEMYFSDTNGV